MLKKNLLISIVVFTMSLSTVRAADIEPRYGFMQTNDGIKLRYAWWPQPSPHERATTIILLQGRGSFIEKNIEFISKLTDLGFSIFTFDWRGMGGSDRILDHPQKNHIVSFDTYTKDINEFIKTIVKPATTDKIVLLGSSLGGQLALCYMHDHPHSVEGAVLMAPMLDIVTDPFPHWCVEPLVNFMCFLGYAEKYAFGYGDHDPNKADFTKNKETDDQHRFWKTVETTKEWPQYITGGPTFGWVKAAIKSMNKTRDVNYLQKIAQPTLLMIAGKDGTVINTRNPETCSLMPKCIHKTYADALHNLMKAPDSIRRYIIQDIDEFIKQAIEIKR